jgi:hypothetical protein
MLAARCAETRTANRIGVAVDASHRRDLGLPLPLFLLLARAGNTFRALPAIWKRGEFYYCHSLLPRTKLSPNEVLERKGTPKKG